MLNDETLKEIGRVTIEFSILDEVITDMAWLIIECTEPDVARCVTPPFIDQKLDHIAMVCKKLKEAHRLENAIPGALLTQIGLAKGIVSKRNTIIRGELESRRGGEPLLRLGKKDKEPQVFHATPHELADLVDDIHGVTNGLMTYDV